MSLQKIFILNHDGTVSVVFPNDKTVIVQTEELLPIAEELQHLQESTIHSVTIYLRDRKFKIVNDILNMKAYTDGKLWFDIDDSNVLITFLHDPSISNHEKI